jgi:soluble lytic murein transglycosylase-like protein
VDPALVLAVASVESDFDSRALSTSGAVGLMQLMPGTAQALGVANPYDPAQNVRGGATYLHELLDRFGGDVSSAVAAYNAGPGAVELYGGTPPFPETKRYVARVLHAYRAFRGD